MKPMTVTDLDLVFGGGGDVTKTLMPPMEEIPTEFKRWHGTKWNQIQTDWFFNGLPKGTEFIAKEGIDKNAALRHLNTIQRSFEPKHEHKEACVAYLMSLWFDDIKVPAK